MIARPVSSDARDDAERETSADQLEALVRAGNIRGARAFLKAHPGLTGPLVRVLAPPTTRTRPASGRGDFSATMEWIVQNRQHYPGQWVALLGAQLVDTDPSRLALQRRIELRDDLRDILVAYIEPPPP